MTASGYGVSLWGDEMRWWNEMVRTAVQCCDCAPNHRLVHFKGWFIRYVNYISIKPLKKPKALKPLLCLVSDSRAPRSLSAGARMGAGRAEVPTWGMA